MSVAHPDFVARFYDPVYDALRTGIDHEFFVRRMRHCSGPVLEVGVGTGRMFVDALAAGVDIFGVDVSAAMLEVLRNKIPPDAHRRVQVMDVRQLSLSQRFNLVLAPFRVFSHLLEVEDQLRALNAIAAHLSGDGEFVFDLFAPDYSLLANPAERQLDFDGEYTPGERLRRYVSVRNHPATQVNELTLEYEWTESGEPRQGRWTFPIRYYFRYELEHLIARSDLQLVDLFGDYQGGPVEDRSRDYILVCRPRAGRPHP